MVSELYYSPYDIHHSTGFRQDETHIGLLVTKQAGSIFMWTAGGERANDGMAVYSCCSANDNRNESLIPQP